MGRYDRLRKIEELDARADHVEIYHLMCGYEFPWDITRALEVALYRTYCVPSISALLDRTGEFYKRTQKRYDDTALIVAELSKWGYDSQRGREAIGRMNRAHGRFDISNDDFLYVLSTFIYEPIRWIDRFGWRALSSNEKVASYYFWREVGKRMGIKEIPDTYEKFRRFSADYERKNFRFAETNRRIGSATRDLFASWLPRIFAPLVRSGIYAITRRCDAGVIRVSTSVRLHEETGQWNPCLARSGRANPSRSQDTKLLYRQAKSYLPAWLHDRKARPARDQSIQNPNRDRWRVVKLAADASAPDTPDFY